MEPCDKDRSRIFLYLDDELRGRELTAWESHVRGCPACRQAVAQERRFLNELRSRRPICRAPMDLRSRVEGIVQQSSVPAAPVQIRARIRKTIEQALPRGRVM
ncbi:MAG: anti-sigma factor family protein [Bryobacteraceae bacterium]